ncbi:unnamed protein product [Gadus morhua 'NCC']
MCGKRSVPQCAQGSSVSQSLSQAHRGQGRQQMAFPPPLQQTHQDGGFLKPVPLTQHRSGAFDRLLFSYLSSFVSVPLRSFLYAVGSLSQRNVSALKHVEANLTNSPEPGDKASLCKPRLSTLLSVT